MAGVEAVLDRQTPVGIAGAMDAANVDVLVKDVRDGVGVVGNPDRHVGFERRQRREILVADEDEDYSRTLHHRIGADAYLADQRVVG